MTDLKLNIMSTMVRPNLDIQYLVPQIIKQKKDILDEIGCVKADYTFVVIAAYLLSTKPDNEIKALTNTTPNIFDNKEVVEIEKRYLKSSSEQIEIVQDLKEKLIQEKQDIFLIILIPFNSLLNGYFNLFKQCVISYLHSDTFLIF